MKPFPFQQILDWYILHGRKNLPWRNYDFDNKTLGYRVWLSEIILQQTQASRWIEYFNKIITAFPTVEILASTSYDDFFEYYKWLGYYSRARNMLKSAIIVRDSFWWVFPENTQDLLTLPWVGPYTAEAIRAFAYQKTTLSFDTNLHKVFSRYYYWDKFHALTKSEIHQIQDDFQSSWISWRNINNALMDFSTEFNTIDFTITKPLSSVLTPSQEQGSNTTIINNYPLPECRYFTTQGKLEPLKVKKKSSFPTKDAQVIIILHKDHKVYYSEDLDNYKPFHIPHPLTPSLVRSGNNSRGMAKEYFKQKFNLDISVRPPHKKDFHNWKPFIECYAQIQKGEHCFGIYTKKDLEIE